MIIFFGTSNFGCDMELLDDNAEECQEFEIGLTWPNRDLICKAFPEVDIFYFRVRKDARIEYDTAESKSLFLLRKLCSLSNCDILKPLIYNRETEEYLEPKGYNW